MHPCNYYDLKGKDKKKDKDKKNENVQLCPGFELGSLCPLPTTVTNMLLLLPNIRSVTFKEQVSMNFVLTRVACKIIDVIVIKQPVLVF